LFDEPLSNLDVTCVKRRGELRELVKRLGLPAVYVTHDQGEAFALCDRIAVMFQGQILQLDEPRGLYEHPARVSVARFLGRNNLIRVMRLSAMKTETGEFKTLEGGHLIRLPVKPAELPPLNQPCTLAIRPEHLVIGNGEVSGENMLPAIVREIQFAGATTMIMLDANGLILEALQLSTASGLAIGDTCVVVLPAACVGLLRE
jgi:ABC-type Fe3+/spermidine/putrescine transport system ATPase subunit